MFRSSINWMLVSLAAVLIVGCNSLSSGPSATDAAADPHAGHRIYRPDDIKWTDGPPTLPPGAKMVILDGDPAKEGPIAIRFWLPDGYKVMPHWHPMTERVTVISGTLNLGFGETFDASKTESLPAGTYGYWTPGVRHFAWTKGETVLQLNSIGPWKIIYVNPADDPRNQKR